MSTREFELRPDEFVVDDARNLSRAGLPHDPGAVQEMAALLLEHGQLAPVEVVLPDGWAVDDFITYLARLRDTRINDQPGEDEGEAGLAVPPEYRPRLVYGFRRRAAGGILGPFPRERWTGFLRCTAAPVGLTDEELEDRNLVENLGGVGVAFIDLGLAAHHLTADPKDGGRGEEPKIAAARLKVTIPDLRKLLLLPGLCDEARVLSRLHHRNPERGLNPIQALKLARRPVELQRSIIANAEDAGHNVTPKAMRTAIAPHQGRQGQPPGVTGAQLGRVARRLGRMQDNAGELQRAGLTREQVALVRDVCLALTSLDGTALAALPGKLGFIVEAEVTREPER